MPERNGGQGGAGSQGGGGGRRDNMRSLALQCATARRKLFNSRVMQRSATQPGTKHTPRAGSRAVGAVAHNW